MSSLLIAQTRRKRLIQITNNALCDFCVVMIEASPVRDLLLCAKHLVVEAMHG